MIVYKIIIRITILLLLTSTKIIGQTEGFANTKECNIHYKILGSGDPILIINGGPGLSFDGFEELAIILSVKNTIILYDQRGTGKSTITDPDSTNVNMDLMTDDIEQLRKHLKINDWIVFGHSFGGMLASYYTVHYPENVKKLILSCSGGIDLELLKDEGKTMLSKLSKSELDSLNFWSKKIQLGDKSEYVKRKRADFLAPAYLYNKQFSWKIAERIIQSNPTINQLVWTDLKRIKFDCSEKLTLYKKPVLIISGKQDVIAKTIPIRTHQILKGSKLVFIKKCGHYPWIDNPKIYLKEICSFVRK